MWQVDWLTEKMRASNFTVSAMHGDMPQKEREAIMVRLTFTWRELTFTWVGLTHTWVGLTHTLLRLTHS
jgi:hypothetical protein